MSGTPQLIPTRPGNRRYAVTLAGKPYLIRQVWNEVDPFSAVGGTYCLDIGDSTTGGVILAGIPLVLGTDLLGQFDYMDFGGKLVVTNDRDAGDAVTHDGLGTTSRLYFIPDAD